MTPNRRKMQVTVGLYGDVTMSRNVYIALIASCTFVGGIIGASIVGLLW